MATKTDEAAPEDVIRKYLTYLDDPDKLRDEAEIQRAQQAVDDAQDPIERLKALADLERVANVDEAPLREGFVAHAKVWAEEQAIPLSAFRQMNVPDDVLRQAGFELPVGRRRGRRATAGEGRPRAKAVSVEEIKAYVSGLKGTFILTDIMNGIGGSQATVRKAVDELIEAGQVEKLGPVPGYSGRGRAPVQYSKA
jgi:hypothetical protein